VISVQATVRAIEPHPMDCRIERASIRLFAETMRTATT
jgi:hypothetical protein